MLYNLYQNLSKFKYTNVHVLDIFVNNIFYLIIKLKYFVPLFIKLTYNSPLKTIITPDDSIYKSF